MVFMSGQRMDDNLPWLDLARRRPAVCSRNSIRMKWRHRETNNTSMLLYSPQWTRTFVAKSKCVQLGRSKNWIELLRQKAFRRPVLEIKLSISLATHYLTVHNAKSADFHLSFKFLSCSVCEPSSSLRHITVWPSWSIQQTGEAEWWGVRCGPRKVSIPAPEQRYGSNAWWSRGGSTNTLVTLIRFVCARGTKRL